MANIVAAARDLIQVVDGTDWEPARVRAAQDTLYAALDARDGDMDEAFTVLLGRLSRSRVEDGDGVAHVAITAGALVEAGASAHMLVDALLPKLVPVLRAARRYADRCLDQLEPPVAGDNEQDREDLGETMADAALRVDGRPRSAGYGAKGIPATYPFSRESERWWSARPGPGVSSAWTAHSGLCPQTCRSWTNSRRKNSKRSSPEPPPVRMLSNFPGECSRCIYSTTAFTRANVTVRRRREQIAGSGEEVLGR
ncbi:hypothetical protein [Nocardia carnea]|uniref:hypothetical protein n=1 Tax=Nocardia carnea TaxID=37328 RepID=UPI0024588D39|nr:hypothetical protein [Nocardia carnea]